MRYDPTPKTATTLGDPLGSPVTIAEAEATIRVVDVRDNAEIARQLLTATKYCENRQHRVYLTSSWYVYMDCFPPEIILENRLPIASIVAITYTDTAGDTQTLSSALYQTDLVSGDRPARIMPIAGTSFPAVATQTYNAVRIELTSGWTTTALVPSAIKDAIKLQTLIGFDVLVDERALNAIKMSRDSLLDVNNPGLYR